MSSSFPYVSVIIPCHNMADYLPKAIESILGQTLQSWEILVIDDGSLDETQSVTSQYKNYENIKYYHQDHGGLGSARNHGLRAAIGQFIQFLDADDFLHKDKFEQQVSQLIREPSLDAVFSDFKCVDESGQRTLAKYASPQFETELLVELILRWERGFSIPCHCFLFRRDVFVNTRFDERLPNHEDWDLYIRLAVQGFNIRSTPQVLAYYRIRANSMSRNKTMMTLGRQLVLEKASELGERARELVSNRLDIDVSH